MLDGLADCIKNEKDQKGFIPSFVAQKWSSKAKHIYNNAPVLEKKLGCHLLMIGTFPVSKITIGDACIPKTALIRLCSPNFKPYVAHQHEILSIGSGSSIDDYRKLLAWCDSNTNDLFKFAEHIDGNKDVIIDMTFDQFKVEKVIKFGVFEKEKYLQIRLICS